MRHEYRNHNINIRTYIISDYYANYEFGCMKNEDYTVLYNIFMRFVNIKHEKSWLLMRFVIGNEIRDFIVQEICDWIELNAFTKRRHLQTDFIKYKINNCKKSSFPSLV